VKAMSSTEADLRRMIRNARSAISEAQASNAIIDEKITCLKNALVWLNGAIDKAASLKSQMSKRKVSDPWKGLQYDFFDRECHRFGPEHIDTHIKQLQGARNDVKKEIRHLESEKNHLVALITNGWKRIENLNREIAKLSK